jgi:hypothetical protein
MTYEASSENGLFSIEELNAMHHKAAKKYAKIQGIPRTAHPSYNELIHPTCSSEGCNKFKIVQNWHWTSGTPIYRPICQSCHVKRTAGKHGLKRISQVVAKNAGFSTETAYLNSIHPYRKYRKDYCENVDGRLGYKCTSHIFWHGMLDVDHINENPTDNNPENLQTLCACCHRYKGNIFIKKNGVTPGRKSLKSSHINNCSQQEIINQIE